MNLRVSLFGEAKKPSAFWRLGGTLKRILNNFVIVERR